MISTLLTATAALLLAGGPAHAAPMLDGAHMAWAWAVPFVGLLITIATGPLLFHRVWHAHYGKIAAAWAIALLAALAAFYGIEPTLAAAAHSLLGEYLSFIVLLFALYTVAGGIVVTGNIRGTPANNTLLIALGTVMASFVGTTGAAMILIRPVLHANAGRVHRAHVIVFFIILVANVGGALTPLGDPPLFLGFLRGVDFFWAMTNLWPQTLIVAVIALVVFFIVDTILFRREGGHAAPAAAGRIGIRGTINAGLIACIIAIILLSALWRPGLAADVLGTRIELQDAVRNVLLLLVAYLSVRLTPAEHRESNGFSWEPIREVAKLFAAIFVAIIPVLAMLQAGRDGPFAGLLALVTEANGAPHEAAYFWLTGALSAFLDNAPTYVVFFELAGGDAGVLMGPLAGTLAGISMGAVYMGALTYIGNAPNFMIYAIAEERGVRMPSFFAYLAVASLILLPIFVLITLLPVPPILKPS